MLRLYEEYEQVREARELPKVTCMLGARGYGLRQLSADFRGQDGKATKDLAISEDIMSSTHKTTVTQLCLCLRMLDKLANSHRRVQCIQAKISKTLDKRVVHSRRTLQLAALGFKLFAGTAPPHLLAAAPPRHTPPKPLRHSRVFAIPLANTEAHLKSPILQACHLFNSLPHNIRSATSYQQFMSLASPHFLSTQCCCSAHIPPAPFPFY